MTAEGAREATPPLRVIVADDHPLARRGPRALLAEQEDRRVVGEAVDDEEALDLMRRERPDMSVLDARMPRLDGIRACKRIKGEALETQV